MVEPKNQSENIVNISDVRKSYLIPKLFEVWNWVGDESVLPYKWNDVISKSNLNKIKNSSWDKDKLLIEYINKDNFNKKAFFFITHRSETAGITYLNINKETIPSVEFLLVNPKFNDKNIEHALLTLVVNLCKELNIEKIQIDLNTTTFNLNDLTNLLF